ncbi:MULTISPECIES: conjugal transfer protein TrbL family protein [Lactococcus]|uniref:Protein TrsL n=3 Tax=Lactococcus TaxID=1357 RepID=O87221_9LACT|nr:MULTISPECIES: conjugal transfer protein TrbL family protein [Lactococcus]AAC56003.1 trsL protein (traL) [Lactococcus lactis]KEY61671.1 TrsL protein [Lactococcus cremoris subsp. cremoris GE214]MDM7547443.1 protein TrsL [Lactococcus lactis]MDT2868964.1 protein TrsL [Lactococcus lactis]OEU38498.1 hypothetical protein AJ89_13890 [Lactococcus cremoris subsp. cremoris IBB477]
MDKLISSAIGNFLKSTMTGILKWIMSIMTGTVDLLDTNLSEIAKYYAIFLAFSGALVVAVVLARIITTMLKEADDTTDATWANIVMDSLKSAVSIPIMVFIQGFLVTAITVPLIKYIFDDTKGLSMKTINHAIDVSTGTDKGFGLGVPLLIIAFFLVVMVVFFVKIGVFVADLAFFNLAVPLVAVSIASENFEYASTWWKKLVYLNVSIITQTLSLALMVASLGLLDKGWGYLAFTIGFGFLVIKAPTIVQDLWQSTGLGKATVNTSMRTLSMMMRKR